jgi:hypothetical protein
VQDWSKLAAEMLGQFASVGSAPELLELLDEPLLELLDPPELPEPLLEPLEELEEAAASPSGAWVWPPHAGRSATSAMPRKNRSELIAWSSHR